MTTRPPAVPIDLTTLASTYRVIRTSPAYPAVQDAIARLRAAEREVREYADRDKDVALLREFAAMLRANHGTIGRALVTAALVGRLRNADTMGEELAEGLGILRDRLGLAFDGSDVERETQRELLQTARELWEDPKGLPNVDAALERKAWPPRPEQFVGVIRDAVVEVRELKVSGQVLKRAEEQIWDSLAARIAAFVTENARVSRARNISELFAAAASESVAALARADLSAMTVAEWSRLFLRSRDEEVAGGEAALRVSALAAMSLGVRFGRSTQWVSALGFSGTAGPAAREVGEWAARIARSIGRPSAEKGSSVEESHEARSVVLLVADADGSIPDVLPEPVSIACFAETQSGQTPLSPHATGLLRAALANNTFTIAYAVSDEALDPGSERIGAMQRRIDQIRSLFEEVATVNPVYVLPRAASFTLRPSIATPKTLSEIVRSAAQHRAS